MAMSQSEYLRRSIANNQIVIARNKTRDASLQTFIVKARASTTMPSLVKNGDLSTTTTYARSTFNGTGGEYISNLDMKIGCAVYSEADAVVNPYIVVSSITESHTIQPWSQQTASINYNWGGKQDFFPPKLSAVCSTNQIRYPFPSG
jgi:hypothetical protein